MTLLRQSQIKKLATMAKEAQATIVNLFDTTAIYGSHLGGVWGQFLDAPRSTTQHGIYGTSAAVQVFVAAGQPNVNALVRTARTELPLVEPVATAPFRDSNDLGLTTKLAACLIAAERDSNGMFVREEEAEKVLLASIIDDAGWGNFCPPVGTDVTPRLVPTIHALLALSKSRSFVSSKQCSDIIAWLVRQLLEQDAIPAHQLALGAQTLLAYPGSSTVQNYSTALALADDRLERWARTRHRSAIGEVASFHFEVPAPGSLDPHNHYLFHVPDALVANYMLSRHNSASARGYVVRTVSALIANVKENGGFRSSGSGRLASVDQVAVYHLLGAFVEVAASDPASLLPRPIEAISGTSKGRAITSSLSGVGAIVLTFLATDSQQPDAVRAIAAVGAALATGVLATAWWAWWGAP